VTVRPAVQPLKSHRLNDGAGSADGTKNS
jgi:hypothetical protein